MKLGLISLDYQLASIGQLEKAVFSYDQLAAFLQSRNVMNRLSELVLISTCNRTEMYFVAEDIEATATWLVNEFTAYRCYTELGPLFRKRFDRDVIDHLFRVVSGLESMVFGENEILGQVKEAYQTSNAYGLTGPLTNKLFNAAIATGKRVRSETNLSKGAYSVSSIAVNALTEAVSDYKSKSILVLGGGTMGMRVISKLRALGHTDITLSNRSESRAKLYCDQVGISFLSYEDALRQYHVFDVVFVALRLDYYVITKSALSYDRQTPLFVIDLGLPRNVDPMVQDLDLVDLVGLDELRQVADKTIKERGNARVAAEALISLEMDRFYQWFDHRLCLLQSA